MEAVTAVHLREANFDEAEAFARQQIVIDNLRESSHRQLLEALARNGSRQEALAHFNDLQQLLQDEMAIEPEVETIDLVDAIRSGELASSVPTIPRRSIWFDNDKEPADHNLPQLLTSFVGREKEMAAARVNVLSVAQISARLDDRFRLLTGGSRTALPRQQTLRALIDWSWDLLEEPEKILLRRLSVFAGSMVLEAVEAVCAGDGIDAYDLLDILSGLVNKSLVISHRQQGQETRYRLLETIRQYAQE